MFWFSGKAYTEGVEEHTPDGVRIYSAAKSVADCFKFRNKLGTSVAIEALRTGLEERLLRPAELLQYARICRVERVMKPYLESIL